MCHRFCSPSLLATGCFEPGQSNRQFIIQIMRVKIVLEDTIQFFQIFMKNVIRPKMNGSNGILSRIAEKCWWKAAAAWLGRAYVGNQSAAEHAAVPPCCSAAVLQYPARAPRTLASRRSCGGPAHGEQWPIHRPQICEYTYKPLIFLYRSSSSPFVLNNCYGQVCKASDKF